MDDISSKPFGMGYVLRTTVKHMKKSIDISIRKTSERIAEFDGNSGKSQEVLKTLSTLYAMRKIVDDFQLENKVIFVGD